MSALRHSLSFMFKCYLPLQNHPKTIKINFIGYLENKCAEVFVSPYLSCVCVGRNYVHVHVRLKHESTHKNRQRQKAIVITKTI